MSSLRNVFAFEEEDPEWKDALAPFPNKVPRFASVKDCLDFFEKYILIPICMCKVRFL